MSNIKPVTWVLVADARQAQIYTKKIVEKHVPMTGTGGHMKEVRELELVPILPSNIMAESEGDYQIGRNATGMVFESFSTAVHMNEPHVTVEDEIRRNFSIKITEMLNSPQVKGNFDRLIIVAPPKMLNDLENGINKEVSKKIVGKLAKELTHYSGVELLKHLRDIV